MLTSLVSVIKRCHLATFVICINKSSGLDSFLVDRSGCSSHPPNNSHIIDIFLYCFIREADYKINTESEFTMGCNLSESEQAKKEKVYLATFSAMSLLLRYNK